MKLLSHLLLNANKEKLYAHYANTTGKIKLKGERKEWFGLLPVFCRREDTHCLNSLVLVYHTGHNNILPKSVPSLSTHRVTQITSYFKIGRSAVLFLQLSSFLSKTVARPFCVFVFANRRRTWVAIKVCRVLKMWLGGDSSMKVSGFLSSCSGGCACSQHSGFHRSCYKSTIRQGRCSTTMID